MIGMVTSCTGKQTLLPALLQWNIKRTDGEPCDSFSVQFLCGKTTKELLEQATEFRATEREGLCSRALWMILNCGSGKRAQLPN